MGARFVVIYSTVTMKILCKYLQRSHELLLGLGAASKYLTDDVHQALFTQVPISTYHLALLICFSIAHNCFGCSFISAASRREMVRHSKVVG